VFISNPPENGGNEVTNTRANTRLAHRLLESRDPPQASFASAAMRHPETFVRLDGQYCAISCSHSCPFIGDDPIEDSNKPEPSSRASP
jgi:hypothetical protein